MVCSSLVFALMHGIGSAPGFIVLFCGPWPGVWQRPHEARWAEMRLAEMGWAGVLVVSAVTAAATAVFFAAPAALASLYTDEPALRGLAAALIFVGGFTLVLDGAQMVLQGALRGLADIWTTSLIQFSAWWVVCVPLGYGLALASGLGPSGLIWAILAGAIVASSVSALRFRALTARGIVPA